MKWIVLPYSESYFKETIHFGKTLQIVLYSRIAFENAYESSIDYFSAFSCRITVLCAHFLYNMTTSGCIINFLFTPIQ